MKPILKILLPVVVIGVGLLGAKALVDARRPVVTETSRAPVRVVRVLTVERQPLVHEVRAFGTVAPRAETTLVAEVTGRIVSTSPAFVTGGVVDSEQVLLEIDPSTYDANLAAADADLARADAALSRELAEAEIAAREWKKFGAGEPSPLVLRTPQVAEDRAAVAAATARQKRARLDLERTTVKAPYRGRIRERFVEEGRYVTAGSPVAVVYAIDVAEVRLPISPTEIAYLDLPLGGEVMDPDGGPSVTLISRIGGREFLWPAWITRTEGEVDARTRSVRAVARVQNPYDPPQGRGAPPLLVGMFVEAVISGRKVEQAAVVPRRAVEDGRVWIVDGENRLHAREVEVLRLGSQQAWIGEGLENGDRVCTTVLDVAVEDMKVRIASDPGEQ